MKSDQYLTLCLEQAHKSPLHYRHGCIIVRGGKVIGQGFNDYRPGFNGGALKHGRIAKSALTGPAMSELKEKLKKRESKPFTPIPCSNVPLSMHSEMMAIQVKNHSLAIRLRPNEGYEDSSSFYRPTLTPSVRQSALATTTFKSAVLKPPHLNQVSLYNLNNNKVSKNDADLNEKKKKEKKKGHRQYQYEPSQQYDRSRETAKMARVHDRETRTATAYKNSADRPHSKKHSQKKSIGTPVIELVTPIAQKQDIKHRQRSSRLNGADLYVARTGGCRNETMPSTVMDIQQDDTDTEMPRLAAMLSSDSSDSDRISTRSLHDELLNKWPRVLRSAPPDRPLYDRNTIHASRPCYRCVSYMHAAGIRRVYWTNAAGEWEGAKVAKLIAALDGDDNSPGDGGPMGNGLFITKHEVLQIRQRMERNK
ncbi:hypothetical protein AMS68_000705 [Peltaster fructicola]|uniref:CMP/dCMP-type deaminase domain-containing protein n=1 Tax=Peltaster fructicola TaxID=286661 RepID=A0A6H0XKM5_9PEZI|nr:hypothetical protein AMS68_000705 [Peltaster fructicola]